MRASTRHFIELIPPSGTSDTVTVRLALTPSAVESGPYTEPTTTERITLTPSSSEIAIFVDSAVEGLALSPSGIDSLVTLDSATEIFSLTPSANEHYCPQKVEFEGFEESRWSAEQRNRWSASEESRWSATFLGTGEGFAC